MVTVVCEQNWTRENYIPWLVGIVTDIINVIYGDYLIVIDLAE